MFFQRLEELCAKKGTNPTAVCKLLTKSTGNLSTWKNGNARNDHLASLAKYFEVSVDYLLGLSDNPRANAEIPYNDFIPMPVIGSISAGYDGVAVEEQLGTCPVSDMSLHGYPREECFVLRVKGSSMYPNFHEGDHVLVHRQSSIDSGEIAIVLYDSIEATLKKVEYIKGKNWVKLIPFNPEYETKIIKDHDLEQCRVLGKVITIVYRENL